MDTRTLPALPRREPPPPGDAPARRDPLARRAATAAGAVAVLWLALMQQPFLAEHLLGLEPVAAPPRQVSIDAVGFEADVYALRPTEEHLEGRSLVPPQTYDGYWLASYGMPGEGSQNTTYIAGHSLERIALPFNRLSDPALVGAELEVETVTGTLDYVVDSVTTYEKDTLKDSEIWTVVPNRVVLISCYTQDAVGKNVVVTASPAP